MYCTVRQWKRLSITKNFNIDEDNINSDRHVENKERRVRENLKLEYSRKTLSLDNKDNSFYHCLSGSQNFAKDRTFWNCHILRKVVKISNVPARSRTKNKCWNFFAWTMNSVKNRKNNNQDSIKFFQRGLKQIVKDW